MTKELAVSLLTKVGGGGVRRADSPFANNDGPKQSGYGSSGNNPSGTYPRPRVIGRRMDV